MENYEDRSLTSAMFESKLNTAFFSVMFASLIVYLVQVIVCYVNYRVVPISYDFLRLKTHCSANPDHFLFLLVSISLSIALSAFGLIREVINQKRISNKKA